MKSVDLAEQRLKRGQMVDEQGADLQYRGGVGLGDGEILFQVLIEGCHGFLGNHTSAFASYGNGHIVELTHGVHN